MSLQHRNQRDIEKNVKKMLAHEVTALLRQRYPEAKASWVETNNGAMQILLEQPDGSAHHLTISKARK